MSEFTRKIRVARAPKGTAFVIFVGRADGGDGDGGSYSWYVWGTYSTYGEMIRDRDENPLNADQSRSCGLMDAGAGRGELATKFVRACEERLRAFRAAVAETAN